MNRIKIQNLSFSYGKKMVLKNINLDITNGLYGLLGRNGAGKTTLLKLLVGLLPLQNGKIEICGETSLQEKRKFIGYLPQDFDFYPDMNIEEALLYLGALDNIKSSDLKKRVTYLLDLVNLSQEKKKKIKNLSGGMKRRLGIAQSLLNNPQVLIADEPTAGLDPEERIRFRNLLSDLSERKIVIFSTHIADDLEKTASRLGILEKGQFIYDGTVSNLLAEFGNGAYQTFLDKSYLRDFKREYLVFEQQELKDGVLVSFIHNGRPRSNFKRISPTLESAYLMKIYAKED